MVRGFRRNRQSLQPEERKSPIRPAIGSVRWIRHDKNPPWGKEARRTLRSYPGAGEPSTRAVAAAIANAVFDATGVRLRQVPFTPDRVKAALA